MNEQTIANQNAKTKKWGWASYLIAGLVWALSSQFKQTTADEVAVLVVAIVAGVLYYRLVAKAGFIKNKTARSIAVAIALIVVAAFLIGAVTAII